MRFSYNNVCLEAFSYTLPEEVVTSAQIEARLEPLYRRLRLPEGRLELMTGIAERRFWPAGMLPGQMSVQTAEKAIRIAGLDKRHVGALVHGSVSPRLRRAGHRLRGPPPAGPARGLHDLRPLQRLPGTAQRRRAGGQHDRAGADPRRRGGGHGERPWAGREHDPPAQQRHLLVPQRHQVGPGLADHRLRQRGDGAGRSRLEPHRQPPAGRRGPGQYRFLPSLPRRTATSRPAPQNC